MNNKEKTKIAIEYLTELRDSRQKVLPNEAPSYEAEKDMDIFNIAIKALEGWDELKETIKELSENEGVLTQQEVCKFLVNLMGVIEGGRK